MDYLSNNVAGMNFGYVTENGVNSNVIDRFLYC